MGLPSLSLFLLAVASRAVGQGGGGASMSTFTNCNSDQNPLPPSYSRDAALDAIKRVCANETARTYHMGTITVDGNIDISFAMRYVDDTAQMAAQWPGAEQVAKYCKLPEDGGNAAVVSQDDCMSYFRDNIDNCDMASVDVKRGGDMLIINGDGTCMQFAITE